MGDVANFFGKAVGDWGNAWKEVTSLGGLAHNDVSRFFEREVQSKTDLRGAQLESVLSGVPIIGDFIRGAEGASQLEDLYNNSGKVPEYPGLGSALGSAAAGLSHTVSKIADGKNDLYEYYTGTPDQFRSEMNNMYA